MPGNKALFVQNNVPPGGTCLSSFVIINSGNKILVGKPAKPEIWVERFFVREEMAPKLVESGKYTLPGSHLAWFESPEDAAKRVLREMLGLELPGNRLKLIDVQSHVSDGTPEQAHWDICFVYQAQLPGRTKLKVPEWFSELEFVPKSKLKPEHFSRGHGDVLELAKGKIKTQKAAGKSAAKKGSRMRSKKSRK
jgi:ADP-ribose pyrophosphatase YjhB (NUDIX family)